VNNLLGLGRNKHALDIEQASVYLDGRLDPAATARFDAHIAGCEACRARFAGLRDARAALRSMPQAEPPRSFRLRAADVQAAPRVPPPPRLVRMMPALSAAAIVAFAAIAGADVLRGAGGSSGDMAASKAPMPMAAGARESASGEAAPADARSGFATQTDGSSAPAAGMTSELAPDAPGAAVPPTTDAGSDAADASKAATAQPTPSYRETSDRDTAEPGDGDTAFRIAELIAAAVALAAGGTFIVWRLRRRGVQL
jgi:anti-sigma factor RsiW